MTIVYVRCEDLAACYWEFRLSGMWHCFMQVVHDVLRNCSPFRSSRSIHPMSWHHIPGDLNSNLACNVNIYDRTMKLPHCFLSKSVQNMIHTLVCEVIPCRGVDSYHSFKAAYCLPLQGRRVSLPKHTASHPHDHFENCWWQRSFKKHVPDKQWVWWQWECMWCAYPSYISLEACCFKQFAHSVFSVFAHCSFHRPKGSLCCTALGKLKLSVCSQF